MSYCPEKEGCRVAAGGDLSPDGEDGGVPEGLQAESDNKQNAREADQRMKARMIFQVLFGNTNHSRTDAAIRQFAARGIHGG